MATTVAGVTRTETATVGARTYCLAIVRDCWGRYAAQVNGSPLTDWFDTDETPNKMFDIYRDGLAK